MPEQENQIAVQPEQLCQAVERVPENISVTATSPNEMAESQSMLVAWARHNLESIKAEHAECEETLKVATTNKWRTEPLRKMTDKALKRVQFAEKLLAALENGYTIVPNFPVTAFAIRTDKKNPLRMLTQRHWDKHTQEAAGTPIGEGEYKNPFPVVCQQTVKLATQTTGEVCEYWANHWKDMEFPISMAKPELIEVTSRAMALKVFDDIGILPGYAPGEGTRPPKGDPIIVGRILDRSRSTSYHKHYVSFIICWHVNSRDL